MTAGLESQTWIYRQSAFGAELKLSTPAKSGGVEHHLFLASKGEMKSFDLTAKLFMRSYEQSRLSKAILQGRASL
jgi:hypothetical protein